MVMASVPGTAESTPGMLESTPGMLESTPGVESVPVPVSDSVPDPPQSQPEIATVAASASTARTRVSPLQSPNIGISFDSREAMVPLYAVGAPSEEVA